MTTRRKKIPLTTFPKRIYLYSNPHVAQRLAYRHFGRTAKLYPSTKRDKKYMVYDPIKGVYVHFGQYPYEDYTKHKDKTRRKNYLTRSGNIRGEWKQNKYSPNNLARKVLW
jgi:hypothetical protein